MSFRHTFITEFLYKYDRQEELDKIRQALEEYSGNVKWEKAGQDYYGYFHGTIKDLDSYETKNQEQEIINKLEKVGCKIKIVFE